MATAGSVKSPTGQRSMVPRTTRFISAQAVAATQRSVPMSPALHLPILVEQWNKLLHGQANNAGGASADSNVVSAVPTDPDQGLLLQP